VSQERRKILLISPARARNPEEDFVFKLGFLNLPYLAAATPDSFDLEIVDEEVQTVDVNTPAWLVAVTAQTPVAPRAYEIADAFRSRGVTTVMGGVHASTLPEEALQHVDAVILGEGEFVWTQLLEDLSQGRLQRIYANGTESPLTGLQPPRRDLLPANGYFPLTLVETTRGCPHNCDFCGVSRFFGHFYRRRPADEVLEEIGTLFGGGFRHRSSRFLAGLGLDLPYFLERRLIYFIDSNFAADRANAMAIMDGLKPMDVKWWCHSTVDIVRDEELLEHMSQSGCIAVNIGFESLSPEHLKSMRKSFAGSVDYFEAVKRLHDRNIGVMGTFVVGFDGEDASVFRRIVEFVETARLDWALVFIRTPYPGTSLYAKLEQEGRLLDIGWERFDTLNCVFSPQGMSVEELEQGLRATWKRIFSPRSIWRRILGKPRVHPLFYLGMNMQFFRMTRTWRPSFNPFQSSGNENQP
jgi:radical SAM superfamily enzyme YgiQ (UPF0313 family)